MKGGVSSQLARLALLQAALAILLAFLWIKRRVKLVFKEKKVLNPIPNTLTQID